MPLSEHEQQLLAQMERALYAEDPKFASQMRGSHNPVRRRRLVVGALGVVVGLALVVTSVMMNLWPVGVGGFLVMVAAAAYAFAPGRSEQGRAGAASGSAKRKATGRKSGLVQRMDQRWERRERDR